jgi:hypothetical protein
MLLRDLNKMEEISNLEIEEIEKQQDTNAHWTEKEESPAEDSMQDSESESSDWDTGKTKKDKSRGSRATRG